MTLRFRHLQDDRLFDSYFAERRGDALDPVAAEHLTGCQACGARYAEMARSMDLLREEAEDEADAIFTPDRLHAQQRQVARRIEHVGRAARVINFPRPFGKRTTIVSSSHAAPRWIAAAAAAGLFVGVALGASYKMEMRGGPGERANAVAQSNAWRPLLTPLATRGSNLPDVAADDAFLSDLEMALERPRSHELQALDALTPHVREARDLR